MNAFAIPRILFAVLLTALAGCASDRYLAHSGHSAMRAKNFESAANAFEKESQTSSTNQLLFLLDRGSALFSAGQYDEAAKVFLKAEDIAEIKDYTSISEEVGILATSSNVKGYKGEDFEKVLINVYLALCFSAQGKVESAQVEARKINLILGKMIREGKRNYEESPFARYLSGILWEMNGSYNDAYIDYKKTYEMDPEFPEIGRDLLATSKKIRFHDEYRKWSEIFAQETPRSFQRGEGELIVVFERGLGPVKVPRGYNATLPRFVPRFSPEGFARLTVNEQVVGSTENVLDIETLSIRYLEDRIARMTAAKVAGIAVKGAIAAGVGKATESEDLGWVVFHILQATDRVDLRSWRSLPGSLQMLRVPMRSGVHQVKIEVMGHDGHSVLFEKDFGEIEVKAGKKRFLLAR